MFEVYIIYPYYLFEVINNKKAEVSIRISIF